MGQLWVAWLDHLCPSLSLAALLGPELPPRPHIGPRPGTEGLFVLGSRLLAPLPSAEASPLAASRAGRPGGALRLFVGEPQCPARGCGCGSSAGNGALKATRAALRAHGCGENRGAALGTPAPRTVSCRVVLAPRCLLCKAAGARKVTWHLKTAASSPTGRNISGYRSTFPTPSGTALTWEVLGTRQPGQGHLFLPATSPAPGTGRAGSRKVCAQQTQPRWAQRAAWGGQRACPAGPGDRRVSGCGVPCAAGRWSSMGAGLLGAVCACVCVCARAPFSVVSKFSTVGTEGFARS